MDDDMFDLIFVALLAYEVHGFLQNVSTTPRRAAVRLRLSGRTLNMAPANHFEQLYYNDHEKFIESVRMTPENFDFLISLVKDSLTKHSIRRSISAKCRLFLTLTYLAQGCSRQMLAELFNIAPSTVRKIIAETCDVLWVKLRPIYMPCPLKEEWQHIAEDFNTMRNFPHCIGAIDGKQLKILHSPETGYLTNRKTNNSIVLLAACDTNYEFTNVDIGAFTSKKDGIQWKLGFGHNLFEGQLDLPADDFLPGTNLKFPYFMVGDASFPLKNYLMRPYPGKHLPHERSVFNKHISRVRSVIENAFGVLACRWKILQSPLQMQLSTAERLIMASVLLHNFLKNHDSQYCPPEFVDRYQGDDVIDGLWRQHISTPLKSQGQMSSNNASRTAFKLRDRLMQYISSDNA